MIVKFVKDGLLTVSLPSRAFIPRPALERENIQPVLHKILHFYFETIQPTGNVVWKRVTPDTVRRVESH